MTLRRLRALGGAGILCVALALAGGAVTVGASPEPSAVPVASAVPVVSAVPDAPGPAVDPRSSGTGPGLRGSPIEILLGVVLLGAASAAVTVAWTRLTRRS